MSLISVFVVRIQTSARKRNGYSQLELLKYNEPSVFAKGHVSRPLGNSKISQIMDVTLKMLFGANLLATNSSL